MWTERLDGSMLSQALILEAGEKVIRMVEASPFMIRNTRLNTSRQVRQ